MDYLLRQNNTMFHEKERKIKAIQREDANNKCIHCNNNKPEYISLNNACFVCKNCFKIHQKFPLSISKTIKNNLRSLTLKELQYLYFGGNKKLLEFMKYEYPKLIKLSPSFAYKTIAMDYYRNWLKYLIEGGTRPNKPDIEIAYKSIEDKEFINKNYLNDNENNVITIDFFNDCYNYNDKNNNIITNFINKKYDKISSIYNNNKQNKNNNNKIIKDFLYYKKNEKKDIYDKYINTDSIEFFPHTQNNFFPKKNKIIENYAINNRKKYRDRSSENILLDNNSNFNTENYLNKLENNKNINHEKVLRVFKTNRSIYIKPKHNLLRSFDKGPELEKKQNDINENKNIIQEKENNYEENKTDDDNKKLIKVRRGTTNYKKFEDEKENKIKLNKEKNILNNNDRTFDNSNSSKLDDTNKEYRISKGNSRTRLIKNKFNNNLNDLNYMIEVEKIKENKGINGYKENIIDKQNNFSSNNNIPSIINDNSLNNNNIVFKKKNLKNSFCFYNNNNSNKKRNYSLQQSNFEVTPKNRNSISNKEPNNESNDDTSGLNTARTLIPNKSMKNFYPRYPRKMNRTKTKEKKIKIRKNEDKKENDKLKVLRKEKSEIIQSLKILLKKKDELNKIKKEDNKKDDNIPDEKNEKENNNKDDDNEDKYNNIEMDYFYKNYDKYNGKGKNINLKKKINDFKEVKIIFKEEEEKNKIQKKKSFCKESEEGEIEEKTPKQFRNSNYNKKKKNSYNINEELDEKVQERDSIRGKYKKKKYKYF